MTEFSIENQSLAQGLLNQKNSEGSVENHLDSRGFILKASQLSQKVQTPHGEMTILHALNIEIKQGEKIAIVGRSGSGKSTLLGLLAGLDRASHGQVFLCGQPLHALNEDERAAVRLNNVGFVFQSFQLLNHLSALDNVLLPLTLNKTVSMSEAKTRSSALLQRVGLSERLQQTPRVLSGGEQQRVAIARALVSQPKVIFADEPTGNLDGHTAKAIEDLLFELNREQGTTLILVTHDQKLAARCDRQLYLDDGHLLVNESEEH
jgi:putative ABC transport system ATP-binding protein